MGKKLVRLKQWLPWADRAVGAPGAVDDWKALASTGRNKVKEWVARGAPTVAPTVLWPERVRGWIVGSGYGDMMLLGVALTIQIIGLISLARGVGRKRREARAEGSRLALEARSEALVKRMTRRTWHVSHDDWISPEKAAGIVCQHEVAYVLVEQFIQRCPEHFRKNDDGSFELDREQLLAWLVRSNQPYPPTPKDDETP